MSSNEDVTAKVYAELVGELMPEIEWPPTEAEERLAELNEKVETILYRLSEDAERKDAAHTLVDLLVPPMVDVSLWRDVALARNVQLPASDQYGPVATRLHPPAAGKDAKASKVHSKGDQAPSAFMRRQGEFLAGNAKRIAKAKQQLQDLEEERDQILSGLQMYATTALVKAIRGAMAPVFAMGPAWTVLRAIQDATGREPRPDDRQTETHRILVVLHALRDHHEFRSALKIAILDVCQRFAGEARRSHKDPFDGPYDYEEILGNLGWPSPKKCIRCGMMPDY